MRRFLASAAGTFLLTACGATSSNSSLTYAIYTYRCCVETDAGTTTWHAGEHVTLHWTAQAGQPTTDSAAQTLTLRVTLTGPFPSVDSLKQAISQGKNPPGVRSIDGTRPRVSDRTITTPASELDLPADLPPGYYNLDTSAGVPGNTSGGAGIIVIQ